MKIFYSEDQLLDNPSLEFIGQGPKLMAYRETPDRLEAILAALRANSIGKIVSPQICSTHILPEIHDLDLLYYLEHVFPTWSALHTAQRDLTVDCFHLSRPGRAQQGRPPNNLCHQKGYYCFAAQIPIISGTWKAALASASCAVSAAHALSADRSNVYVLCLPPGPKASGRITRESPAHFLRLAPTGRKKQHL